MYIYCIDVCVVLFAFVAIKTINSKFLCCCLLPVYTHACTVSAAAVSPCASQTMQTTQTNNPGYSVNRRQACRNFYVACLCVVCVSGLLSTRGYGKSENARASLTRVERTTADNTATTYTGPHRNDDDDCWFLLDPHAHLPRTRRLRYAFSIARNPERQKRKSQDFYYD